MCKIASLFDLEGFPKSGKGKKRITSDSDAFYVERVNYPSNCFTLNLANDSDVQANGITNIRFLLKKPENVDTQSYRIDLNVIGHEIATNRDITEHFFYFTGDTLKARPGMSIKYVMEISANVYNEQDKSKNCRNYPDENFASYFDCEEHFVQQICKTYGVAPIWLYKDFKNVTKDPVYSPGTCAFK